MNNQEGLINCGYQLEKGKPHLEGQTGRKEENCAPAGDWKCKFIPSKATEGPAPKSLIHPPRRSSKLVNVTTSPKWECAVVPTAMEQRSKCKAWLEELSMVPKRSVKKYATAFQQP